MSPQIRISRQVLGGDPSNYRTVLTNLFELIPDR